MEWVFRGIKYVITTERLGPFYLVSARVPQKSPFVRYRPFSAVGTSEDTAIELVKEQIQREYRKLPEPVG